MHPALLLVIYCLVCVAFSLVGGWVLLVVRLTHQRMQIAISFVSGVILGIGLLHLVPHSFALLRSIDATVMWVMAGFLFMFFLERFFHFHQHEATEEPMSLVRAPADGDDHVGDAAHSDAHHPQHGHTHSQPDPLMPGTLSWGAAAIGLTLHGLIDGVAIAAAVMAEQGQALTALAGLGTLLAVALHKPFDALTIGALMTAAGRSVAARHWLNVLYATVTPLGVLLFYALSARIGEPSAGLGQVLAFAAGAFICIASSDLLPELQFHGHDRMKLSLALIVGIALAWATVLVEGGHDHPRDHEDTHEAEHDHPHEDEAGDVHQDE